MHITACSLTLQDQQSCTANGSESSVKQPSHKQHANKGTLPLFEIALVLVRHLTSSSFITG
jgi:hypothetical protein